MEMSIGAQVNGKLIYKSKAGIVQEDKKAEVRSQLSLGNSEIRAEARNPLPVQSH